MSWFNTKPDHTWGTWEEYEQPMVHIKTGSKFMEHHQKRTCKVCGKTQREEVRGR